MHNLSFWEGPDWRRESTLNPYFVMGVVIALFVIVAFAGVSLAYSSKLSTERELADLKGRNKAIAEKAEKVKSLKTRTNTWESVLDELTGKRKERLVISRQLEALHRATPPAVILTGLELHAETVEMPAEGDREKREAVRYGISLSGEARGDNAQSAVTLFANRLRPGADSVIGRRLQSSELKNISGGRFGEDAKNFNIVGTYKPAE